MAAAMSPGPDGAGGQRERMVVQAAVLAASSGPGVDATLRHLVRAAATLVDARYAAIGVLGAGGMLDDFVQLGIDDQTRE